VRADICGSPRPESFFLFFFGAVLGLELRAYNLEPLHQPLFCEDFFRDRVSRNYLPGLALNCDPPILYLLSS
jgi:hypothetical protein